MNHCSRKQPLSIRPPSNRLLDTALDHLTLGRAAFYVVMLAPLGPRGIGFQPVGQLSSDKGRLEAYPTVELADTQSALL